MLVHGDLHTQNLGVRRGRLLVVDWADATIGSEQWDVLCLSNELLIAGIPHDPPLRQPAEAFAAIAGMVMREYHRWADTDRSDPNADTIRRQKTESMRAALSRAAELLELPPPDGPLFRCPGVTDY